MRLFDRSSMRWVRVRAKGALQHIRNLTTGPVLYHTGIRTAIIMDRWKAGEDMQDIAVDYGQPMAAIEEVIRCETDRAA